MDRRKLALAVLLLAATAGLAPRRTAAADAPPTFDAALADFQAKRYEAAIDEFEAIRDDLREKDPRSPRLPEAIFYLGESRYALGDKYAAHLCYREILEAHKGFQRLADAISREYEIGTAFIDGKAEKPLLFFRVKSQSLGAEILQYLVDNFQEKYFDTAQYLVGDYYFRDKDWRRAADAYLRIEDDFPGSHWVSVAMFQRALCYMKMHRGYRYDDTNVRKAEKILKDYVRRYPRGDRIKEAEAVLQSIREDRARFYLETAAFYAKREGRPKAALVYLEAILREGRDTPAAGEVPRLLARVADLGQAKDDLASAQRAKDLLAEIARTRSIAAPATPAAPASGVARVARPDGAPAAVRAAEAPAR
jgi:TolA-binding protein